MHNYAFYILQLSVSNMEKRYRNDLIIIMIIIITQSQYTDTGPTSPSTYPLERGREGERGEGRRERERGREGGREGERERKRERERERERKREREAE